MVAPLHIAASFLMILGTGATAHAQEPLWPMANGSHDVLHSFQNPFSFSSYFHEGVDLRGSLDNVVAKRSGTVRYKNQADSGGTLLVETPSGECDSYLHIIIAPWLEGDPISLAEAVPQSTAISNCGRHCSRQRSTLSRLNP